VLTKAERSAINKKNRADGYRAEYDAVVYLRNHGCWAKRLKQKEQRKEMSCVDGYYWDPFRQVFGFLQAKVRKELLHHPERELIIALCKKYRCEGMFFWRDYGHGMKFEFLIKAPQPGIPLQATLLP